MRALYYVVVACVLFLASAGLRAAPVEVNIAAQPLDAALNVWADQTGYQVLLPSDFGMERMTAPAIAGSLTPEAALQKLLESSGFTYKFVDAKTVAILNPKETRANNPADSTAPAAADAMRLSRSDEGQPAAKIEQENTGSKSSNPQAHESEVVVTGTHIRGLKNPASPLRIYTRDDIDRSGAGSVKEFVQHLPQQFNSASENSINGVTGGGTTGNGVGATGIDLRGLGSDSTLVLVNGRRLAPGNTTANLTDVSLIPLVAVDRVEMIVDGASAIYGSDAVGGVVNFILRRDFEGAETRLRYGTVDSGGHHEITAGQTFGHGWKSGSALLSYEFASSTPLSASQRSYTSRAQQPFTLLPDQKRHSVFLTANQSLIQGLNVFADATYSTRSTYYDASVIGAFAQRTPTDVEARGGTLGMDLDLAADTKLELSASYADSDTHLTTIELGNGALVSNRKSKYVTQSADAKIDGVLLNMDSGAIRYAVGGQYRKESFDTISLLTNNAFRPDRTVRAGYAELNIPLVGAGNSKAWAQRIELSLADRYERYGDFGSTNNPKAGLSWQTSLGLTFKGTYGTSFKAPLLNDLNPVPTQVVPFPQFDPLIGANRNVLIVLGGNPGLQPEEAKTWSFGMDYLPPALPGFHISASYYDIHFTDRIVSPAARVNVISDGLRLENVLGSEIIMRNPPGSVVQAFAATPGFFNIFNINLATIGAIVDARSHNLSIVDTSGLDLSVSYERLIGAAQVSVGLDATRMIDFDNKFSETSNAVEVLNTPYNPVDLRVRAQGSLELGSWASSLFINYVDSYNDNRGGTITPISSWTTIDTTLSYRPKSTTGLLSDVSIMLGILNLADRSPPTLANPNFPIFFDGSNANALGRFYSLQISKGFL